MDVIVRWNALDPNDEHSSLIVPREDLRALEAEVERLRAALQKVYDAGKPPEGRRWLGNESRIAAIAGEALGLPVTSGKPATPPNEGMGTEGKWSM